jgi:hypothetical protein
MIPTVSISKMTGKLDGIQAINTNTATNAFCIKESSKPDADKICGKCYSMSMLSSYRKNCQPAFQRNSDVLASDAEFILPRTSGAFVRFHGHGELINEQHFRNLCAIASDNKHSTFALWTKRVGIVRKNLHHVPDNMILVYSNPKIDNVMSSPPRGFDRVFNNVSESYDGEANCTGQKCMDCLLCYKHDTTQVIVEHVK